MADRAHGGGAALATGFALAAVTLASVEGVYTVSVLHGLLSDPGTRSGVIAGLLLLLVPVLAFLGQCTRIGAVHRDRRLAGLRLAGATPWQVRRVAALETGLACLAGSVVATTGSVVVLLRLWSGPNATTWAGIALVAVGVPVLGAAAGALALRRVVTSPLGRVRRVRPAAGRGPGLLPGRTDAVGRGGTVRRNRRPPLRQPVVLGDASDGLLPRPRARHRCGVAGGGHVPGRGG